MVNFVDTILPYGPRKVEVQKSCYRLDYVLIDVHYYNSIKLILCNS